MCECVFVCALLYLPHSYHEGTEHPNGFMTSTFEWLTSYTTYGNDGSKDDDADDDDSTFRPFIAVLNEVGHMRTCVIERDLSNISVTFSITLDQMEQAVQAIMRLLNESFQLMFFNFEIRNLKTQFSNVFFAFSSIVLISINSDSFQHFLVQLTLIPLLLLQYRISPPNQ